MSLLPSSPPSCFPSEFHSLVVHSLQLCVFILTKMHLFPLLFAIPINCDLYEPESSIVAFIWKL